MPRDTAWLAALQVGDKVIVHRPKNMYAEDAVRVVRRLTPKQIGVALSLSLGLVQRFWRASGESVERGSTHGGRDMLLPWSREAEMRLAIRPLGETVAAALQKVTKRDCQALTLAQATEIVAALRQLRSLIQGIAFTVKQEPTP